MKSDLCSCGRVRNNDPPTWFIPVHWNHSWKVNSKSIRLTTIKTLLYQVYYGLTWHGNLCIILILSRDSRLVSSSQNRKHPHFWRERLQMHGVIHNITQRNQRYPVIPQEMQWYTASSQKKGTGHASTQPPIRTPVSACYLSGYHASQSSQHSPSRQLTGPGDPSVCHTCHQTLWHNLNPTQ